MLENNADKLRANWVSLLQKLLPNFKISERIFTEIINSYSSPVRSYHNLEHIETILDLLEQVKDLAQNINSLKFSAWFHDYIYNPQAQDNEAKSAVYAAKVLKQLNIDPEIIQTVQQIILSTKNHQPLVTGIDNLIFLDVDLAILGATSNEYLQYAQAIRQEYSYLSDRDYYQGRIKVLTQFLARKRIYYTNYFYQRLETTARKNIQAEIARLTDRTAN